jgi:hypothetical protein
MKWKNLQKLQLRGIMFVEWEMTCHDDAYCSTKPQNRFTIDENKIKNYNHSSYITLDSANLVQTMTVGVEAPSVGVELERLRTTDGLARCDADNPPSDTPGNTDS